MLPGRPVAVARRPGLVSFLSLWAAFFLVACSGEASHPGPRAVLVSANLTTLSRAPDVVDGVGPWAGVFQEPRTTPGVLGATRARLRGAEVSLSADTHSSEYVRAAVRAGGLRASLLELAGELQGRVQHVVVHWGGSPVHVLNLYAPPRDASSCVTLVLAALEFAAGLGAAPCFLAGDFNQDPLPPAAAVALAVGGWRDLGSGLGATAESGRRLDRVYVNRPGAGIVRAVRVSWEFGLATHAALVLDLEVGAPPVYQRAPRPTPLSGPVGSGWGESAADAALFAHWAPREAGFRVAVASGDLDAAWVSLSSAAEGFLRARLGLAVGQERGHILPTAPAKAYASRVGRALTPLGPATSKLLRRLRTLENALRLWPEGVALPPPAAVARLSAAVRLARHWGHPWWVAQLSGALARCRLLELLSQAREEYWEAERADAQLRRERFKDWLHGSLAVGGRKVFRWVAEPASQAPPALFRVQGELAGGPAAELACLEPFWAPLWTRPDTPGADEPALLAAVARLPPFPALAPLSDADVAEVVATLPLGKAGGLDGWAGEELRLWPGALVKALAELLRAVERLGRWPSGLGESAVCMLPKPGTDQSDPANRRPITLLPVVYRVWARLRLRAVDAWRASWDTAVADAPKGADGQAWDLSCDLGLASGSGEAVGGVSTDFQKFYDTVRLPLVGRVLRAARWPEPLLGPLLRAYAFPRRVRAGDALGQPVAPVSGVPAGCPMAVAVVAVLTSAWASFVEAAELTRARRYVDDLCGWRVGSADEVLWAVHQAWAGSCRFASAAQLTLHPTKSGVFGSTRAVRADLRATMPGTPVLLALKDLGVYHRLGCGRGEAVLARRIAAGVERCGRIAGLPCSYAQRCHLVAASAVAVASFGAVAGPPPQRALRRLRVAAGRAVWRGGGQGRSGAQAVAWAPGWVCGPGRCLCLGAFAVFGQGPSSGVGYP